MENEKGQRIKRIKNALYQEKHKRHKDYSKIDRLKHLLKITKKL